MIRVLSLILALTLAGRPSSIEGQTARPTLTSALVTGGILGTATSALGLGSICAMGGFDDDDIPVVYCTALGAVVGVAPALAAGVRAIVSGPRITGRSSAHSGLRRDRRALEGLVISLASEGDRPLDHILLGGAWGAGVGLITAALGPALQVGIFPTGARSRGDRMAIGLRYVFD